MKATYRWQLRTFLLLVAVGLGGLDLAEARITKIEVTIVPAFGGTIFGEVGAYQLLRGTAYGEVDPNDPRNAVITDIKLAPTNPNGMVEYSMDISILMPTDLSKGNHRTLLDFNNRGQLRLGRLNEAAPTNNPTTPADAGTGFVMNNGYTIVGNGWDFRVAPGGTGAARLGFEAPLAMNPDSSTITGRSYEYINFDNATSMSFGLTFPAWDSTDKSSAMLSVRQFLDDTPTPIPSSGWEYTSPAGTAIQLLTAGTSFQQSRIYEFTYIAKEPVVSGLGLAATRDFISFLRHAATDDDGHANPLAGDVRHTFSYSISQPSRTLNDFVLLGFNEDEGGRRVIDGILSHTGAGNGDQINYRFGQTGRTERNRQNHLYPEGVFPFAHPTLHDHLSGKTDGRDRRCRVTHTCPLRFEVNTSNEYWVKAGSLLHTDTRGRDLKDPRDARFYLISGTSHGVGNVTSMGSCQQFLNPTSPYPAHRALLLVLDDWVSHGRKPPKSEVPRRSDKTAIFAEPRPGFETGVVPQQHLGWPDIPGVTYNGVITTPYLFDFGPDFEDGIVSYPLSVAGRPAYPIFISKVDKDGNEVAGVRLPPVAAPIATTTGWSLRRAGFSENDGCESGGQHIAFKTTKAERLMAGDPRRSLEERYGTLEGYVCEVERVATERMRERFLLQEDVDVYVADAQASGILSSNSESSDKNRRTAKSLCSPDEQGQARR